MQLTKTNKIIIVIGTIVVLIVLYSIFIRNNKMVDPVDTKIIDNGLSTTTTTTNNDGYTVTQLETKNIAPAEKPDLLKAVNITTEMSQEAKDILSKKISDVQKSLASNPKDLAGWINLGNYQKMAGDYEGAVKSWVYAGKIFPTNYISFGNLGNIYAYYLKDNAMAESYYKQAISKGPTQAYLYIQLAEVYRDAFKDNTRSLSIIEQGLVKIPNDKSLLEFKDFFTK